ncbi:anti-sigma factor [Siccirubricoccus deserti]|nr:anti-sigma factor [Siccirubricoccus deserti]
MIRHHPSEATLVSYGAGNLWEAAAVVVGAHLIHCAQCAATVRLAEKVGGAILDSLPPAALAPVMLERAMSRLNEVSSDVAAKADAQHPRRVTAVQGEGHSILPSLLRNAEWRWLAPGIRRAVLLRQPDDGTLHLLRVRSGTALPQHSHRGIELTLVIAGAFVDAAGHYGPDDVAEADEAVSHQPTAEGQDECVCLIATQGRLRFGSLASRLFSAFARI